MTPSDTLTQYTGFLTEARKLQQTHARSISLPIGMETENIHPKTLTDLTLLLQTHKIDYLVGSVHHVHGHPIDFDPPRYAEAERALGGTENLFLAYFDAQYELLRQAKPLVVGHFDLIRIFRHDFALSKPVWEKIRRNVDVIVEYGGLVEINSRAWKKGLRDAYPQRDILQVGVHNFPSFDCYTFLNRRPEILWLQYMISQNIKFTLSDDSHGPDDVGMYYDKLHAYLEEFAIDTVYYPALDSDGQVEVRALNGVLSHPFWNQEWPPKRGV